MEQRKCPECQRWMVLKICHKLGSRWYSAYYQCTYCGVSSTAAVAESRKGAVRALEGLADEEKLIYGRYVEASVDLKPEEEANRALKTYEDYQKLSEALLGRKAGKTAELLEAALRMKRDLEEYKGEGRRYEMEIAKLNASLEYLQKRIVHLLGSKLIMSFDEITSSGEYKRNIEEADEYESKEAVQKIKRALAICESAYQRCEAENARLKQMAAEDILLAAQRGCPCASCANNKMGDGCNFEKCENCENHCTCYECNYSEGFVWRGAQKEKPKARGGKLYAYPIILTEEENGAYSVLIPDFGCATCGKDEIEARFKAAECIVGRMIAMRDDNEPFPAPAEMTDGLLRESCINVGTNPDKAFWALSLVQMKEEH